MAVDHGTTIVNGLSQRISNLVRRAKLVLFWEVLWPAFLPLLGVVSVFLIISWFGLWLGLPTAWRYVGLALFVIAGCVAAWPLMKVRFADKDQALKRIEDVSGVSHRPLSSFEDSPADIASDEASGSRLWEAHQTRLLNSIERLRTGTPRPTAHRVDPFQLRALVVLLLVVSFAYAGTDRTRRLAALTDPKIEVAPALARIDAWITPPAYTRRAPIFLTRSLEVQSNQQVRVPTGSVFSLQSDSLEELHVTVKADGAEQALASGHDESLAEISDDPVALNQFETLLDAHTEIVVTSNFGEPRSWTFEILPDNPPEILFDGQPQVARSGALELRYKLKDDYGVTSAHVVFAPVEKPDPNARPLYDAPDMDLSLPRSRVKEGSGRTIKNLTEHPWAGLEVSMTLLAEDEAEQQGKSPPAEFVLPIRSFRKPLARALVEQRQTLALDANSVPKVGASLDALLFAPEKFINDASNYLAMTTAKRRLFSASDDDQLRDVADLIWEIALSIEDGDLSDVERDLRAAQEALREALENDASEEEIARLTEELRQAMSEYLQALARQQQQNPSAQQQMPLDPNMQMVTPQDLDQMLDQIENLARSGSRDAARELLSDMQQMLESLQNGQPQMSEQQQQMQQMMRDLGDLIERQQSLMDQTFEQQQQQLRRQQLEGQQQGQQQQGEIQPGQQQDQGQQQGQQGELSDAERQRAMQELQQGQADVHDGLQQLMEQMQQNGLQPGGQMGEAEGAMGDATESLGGGQPGQALGAQSRALQALRDGAQEMMQQFAQQGQQGQPGGQQQGQGFQNGQGQQQGRPGGMQTGTDPLGRPQRNRGADDGDSVKVPGEIDIQRAREILDAIRRRLGDIERPELELDYLERLLPR
ncbi:MAG: TIGR02302 family protein [Hyphomicrobiales bacterium]|uniref:TIGR02302 family protein n=1 Tax=Nisaea sp. TaxID=2024842 RepID=UPI003287CBF7